MPDLLAVPRAVLSPVTAPASRGGARVLDAPYSSLTVTGGGMEPAGWLPDLRRRAYPASHVGPDA